MESIGVEGFEELPIFPLATVLFPGAVLPLHIFEERYKAMINFAVEHGNIFGLSYRSDAEVDYESSLELGSVGCAARINARMPLEEGRMNLITVGVVRYRLIKITQLVPFITAKVEPFVDDPDIEHGVEDLFHEMRTLCIEFLVAAGIINEAGDPLDRNLPEEPEAFSLLLASLIPISNEEKQELLEMTSTRQRLLKLKKHVVGAIADYDRHKLMQDRAKGNGKGTLN
jgi:Lon protease-like protein